VPAGEFPDDGGGDSPDDGSSGVREPRRPKPFGPVSGAGQRPVPDDPIAVSLPDPRTEQSPVS
jgi:hypothetical protein